MTMDKKLACVTGGNGYIASMLIKQLLQKGYAVNTTVRNPDDLEGTAHLREMQSIGPLKIMRGDLDEEGSFDEAVAGCEFVFLVAAPVNLMSENPEKELIEPAIQGTLNVLKSCAKAKSVKRVVLTSSAAAVSMKNLEGNGYVLDEEAWSDVEFLRTAKPPTWGYGVSKALAEKEAFRFGEENNLSVVTMLPTLTIGPSLIPTVKTSIALSLSLLTGTEPLINGLKGMQMISGSISFVHVEDICRAHIFVAENPEASGRYICCAVNTSLIELAQFLSERYPQYDVPTEFGDFPEKAKLSLSSEKLVKAGFEFNYKQIEEIYDDLVEYAKSKGLLKK
ncbi:Anthocyanidin reductase [Rhynchospora pubera]|uniref:Anthocyanidin reductase n=1 Tax=Rhynchospora pubera TaxID=906938 RepID=A0AAV8HLJ5_9POAL|nr:Anthocyanidin reductase [Rhynchospora pubera]KAJ4816056.1 Anthocyanidin reductase [Rhynchospora pubera]